MARPKMVQLSQLGQSVWLDYISRSLLDTGKLQGLIKEGLRGMTSNPSIFNAAIGSSNEYDEKISALKRSGHSTFEIYDELTIKDIQDACDAFKNIYRDTKGIDGYVSLEINPLLANQVKPQAEEGKRLFKKVNRPNCMIKVPATAAGITVVEELIAHGINVNVTLIFSLKQYIDAANAYFSGLNRLAQKQSDLSPIRSVASVFVSRIDSTIDKVLEGKAAAAADAVEKKNINALLGKAAVANSRIIFERYKEFVASEAYKKLRFKGGNEQRVLWGSTSTKNPNYSDIKYVTELIASPSVNTIPEKTLMAFLDHGQVKEALTYNVNNAHNVIKSLKTYGIDIDTVCAQLLQEGVVAFEEAFNTLIKSIETKAAQLVSR